jgi:hypothetical protein
MYKIPDLFIGLLSDMFYENILTHDHQFYIDFRLNSSWENYRDEAYRLLELLEPRSPSPRDEEFKVLKSIHELLGIPDPKKFEDYEGNMSVTISGHMIDERLASIGFITGNITPGIYSIVISEGSISYKELIDSNPVVSTISINEFIELIRLSIDTYRRGNQITMSYDMDPRLFEWFKEEFELLTDSLKLKLSHNYDSNKLNLIISK